MWNPHHLFSFPPASVETLSCTGSSPWKDRFSEETPSGANYSTSQRFPYHLWNGNNVCSPALPHRTVVKRYTATYTKWLWKRWRIRQMFRIVILSQLQLCTYFQTPGIRWLYYKMVHFRESAKARCSHIFSIRKMKHEWIVYHGDLEARATFKEHHPKLV